MFGTYSGSQSVYIKIVAEMPPIANPFGRDQIGYEVGKIYEVDYLTAVSLLRRGWAKEVQFRERIDIDVVEGVDDDGNLIVTSEPMIGAGDVEVADESARVNVQSMVPTDHGEASEAATEGDEPNKVKKRSFQAKKEMANE